MILSISKFCLIGKEDDVLNETALTRHYACTGFVNRVSIKRFIGLNFYYSKYIDYFLLHKKKTGNYFFGEIISIALSLIAVIVRDGFTPGFEDTAEPSQTYIFS
jgi:hypothetical protein